jgi:hypothetical protein
LQKPPAQQRWPAPPQGTHVSSRTWKSHTVLEAVQKRLPQQGWPSPPQVVHAPLCWHMPAPPPPQSVPTVTQRRVWPQQPLAQVLPGQQGWPGPPQVSQRSRAEQAAVAS